MITVLRLGHRLRRDPRISTHCALVARAFGAESIVYSGEKDSGLEKSVNTITSHWGGSFGISYEREWRRFIKDFSGKKVHLTMYGIPLEKKISAIKKHRKLLVIIGGSKVPMEVYHMVDYNIGVTNQPHSEVAALAVFLNSFGDFSKKKFRGAMKTVVPQIDYFKF